jgi:hypothetical protein
MKGGNRTFAAVGTEVCVAGQTDHWLFKIQCPLSLIASR